VTDWRARTDRWNEQNAGLLNCLFQAFASRMTRRRVCARDAVSPVISAVWVSGSEASHEFRSRFGIQSPLPDFRVRATTRSAVGS
jgi:hypothetical protein